MSIPYCPTSHSTFFCCVPQKWQGTHRNRIWGIDRKMAITNKVEDCGNGSIVQCRSGSALGLKMEKMCNRLTTNSMVAWRFNNDNFSWCKCARTMSVEKLACPSSSSWKLKQHSLRSIAILQLKQKHVAPSAQVVLLPKNSIVPIPNVWIAYCLDHMK